MKVVYDKAVDGAYRNLSEHRPTGVMVVAEGIHVDLTEERRIVGIEILDVRSKNLPP